MYQIIKGGCNTRHPSPFFTSRPKGINNFLLLIIKTPAVFLINGQEYPITPGTAIILPPHIPYYYHNPNGEYMDDWLHFDFEATSSPFDASLQPNTFFHIGDMDFYSLYIRQLLWEHAYSNTEYKQENIDHLMHVLLNHLRSAFQDQDLASYYNPYFPRLQEIRISMQGMIMHPLSADDYAKQLGISKSHFQHLYTELFGISFQKDYILMRIAYAKDLLETTDLSMEKISEFCGYASEVHFYRQFKSNVELTPAEYRKHYRNQTF